MTPIEAVAATAINLVGEDDYADKLFAARIGEFRRCQYCRDHITWMTAALHAIHIADIE